jgi:uncharacterized short protein YbdD (DUF466 family)
MAALLIYMCQREFFRENKNYSYDGLICHKLG